MKIRLISIILIIIMISCFQSESIETAKIRILNPDKIELGKALFFDKRLSDDNTIACASCHAPEFSFADSSPVSTGIFNRKGQRNTPAIINVKSMRAFFHDGRETTLLAQMAGPLNNPIEMGNSQNIRKKLIHDSVYTHQFNAIYNDSVRLIHIMDAIQEFELSLEFKNSPFDQYRNGNQDALTEDQKKGLVLFNGKANCNACHTDNDFTDGKFHNIGFFIPEENPDSGRYKVTLSENDLGRFKTPTLRNISLTAPYFHDGRSESLREIIELYAKPNPMGEGLNKDFKLKRINLTEIEKYQLLQFLLSLTSFDELTPFVSKEKLMKRHESQNVDKLDYEKAMYLPSFNAAIDYIRLKKPEVMKEILSNFPKPWSDEIQIEIFKKSIEKRIKSDIDKGQHLLFDMQLKHIQRLNDKTDHSINLSQDFNQILKELETIESKEQGLLKHFNIDIEILKQ